MERRAIRHFDYGLLLLAGVLVAYGGLLIYSASLTAYPDGIAGLSHPVVKQALFAAFGLTMMAIIAWMDYRVFGQMAPALYALALLILVVVFFQRGVGGSDAAPAGSKILDYYFHGPRLAQKPEEGE